MNFVIGQREKLNFKIEEELHSALNHPSLHEDCNVITIYYYMRTTHYHTALEGEVALQCKFPNILI